MRSFKGLWITGRLAAREADSSMFCTCAKIFRFVLRWVTVLTALSMPTSSNNRQICAAIAAFVVSARRPSPSTRSSTKDVASPIVPVGRFMPIRTRPKSFVPSSVITDLMPLWPPLPPALETRTSPDTKLRSSCKITIRSGLTPNHRDRSATTMPLSFIFKRGKTMAARTPCACA